MEKKEMIEKLEKMAESNEVDLEVVESVIEYLKKGKEINRNLEDGRLGELKRILVENKKGIEKKEVLEKMKISKGNLSSLLVYMKKGGINILKVGDKLILGDYVKIGV